MVIEIAIRIGRAHTADIIRLDRLYYGVLRNPEGVEVAETDGMDEADDVRAGLEILVNERDG